MPMTDESKRTSRLLIEDEDRFLTIILVKTAKMLIRKAVKILELLTLMKNEAKRTANTAIDF